MLENPSTLDRQMRSLKRLRGGESGTGPLSGNSGGEPSDLEGFDGRLIGTVVRGSSGGTAGPSRKTLTVEVVERRPHKKYGKTISKTKRYRLHAEGNFFREAARGDKVLMGKSRPRSRTKHLRLL
jgi:small subunit ribosomal protein S17